MKIGIVLETKEHEKAWNALRFAIAALNKDNELKIFLMGEGVEVPEIKDDQYDVDNKLAEFQNLGGELLACGTCIRARHMEDTTSCPISTMNDCVDMVTWSDKTVTF